MIGSFNLFHGHRDPQTKALFDVGINGRNTKGEFVEVRPDETVGRELIFQRGSAAASRNQQPADRIRLEDETKHEPGFLEIAELDLQPDTGVEEPRLVLAAGLTRVAVNQANQGCELYIAEQDRRLADDRQNLLYRLPFGFGRMAEMMMAMRMSATTP